MLRELIKFKQVEADIYMRPPYSITVISGALSGKKLEVARTVTLGRNPDNSLRFQGADAEQGGE